MMRAQSIRPIRIVTDPTIMLGKPVIEGTRITVELILEDLAQGATVDELIDDYGLTRDAVLAAIHHAWELTRAEADAAVQRRMQEA